MKQTTVLLLFGGESSEHDVSLSSAKNVYDAIDTAVYSVKLCYISRRGIWQLVDEVSEAGSSNIISVQPGNKRCLTENGEELYPDVILPILHGKNGEDGAVQGLAQLLHVPIVGCDLTSSVLAMDKTASKALFIEAGLSTLPYKIYRSHEPFPSYDTICSQLGTVLFVKPSRAGSSVGVSRVENAKEFEEALQLAARHDSLVLIEKAAINPREVEVAVLGNVSNRTASEPGEIQPDRAFYSYEAKYDTASQSQLRIPAELDTAGSEQIKQQALAAYDALHCQGLARVDFLLDQDGTLYMNEINTMPGFTNISMYPKLWQHSGVSYQELITKLINFAIESSLT